MEPPDQPALSLAEWLVLCLIGEKPTHGQAMASLLGQTGALGQVWRVHKAGVYRAIERLESLGLIQTVGQEPSNQGPIRFLLEATEAGRAAGRAWLSRPVEHVRDIRSELLVKLALLDRAGDDPQDLLAAQHTRLVPVAAALDEHLHGATGFDRTLILWRYETISTAIRFLEGLSLPGPPLARP
ncbi:MAG TPA: PadR family transcriptional regulator [Streptosporangiaceae bacterium]|jgi:PadR family transcriptional regulator AphA